MARRGQTMQALLQFGEGLGRLGEGFRQRDLDLAALEEKKRKAELDDRSMAMREEEFANKLAEKERMAGLRDQVSSLTSESSFDSATAAQAPELQSTLQEQLKGPVVDMKAQRQTRDKLKVAEEVASPEHRARVKADMSNLLFQMGKADAPMLMEDVLQQERAAAAEKKAKEEDRLLKKQATKLGMDVKRAQLGKLEKETDMLGKEKPADSFEKKKFAVDLNQKFLKDARTKSYQTIKRSSDSMERALDDVRAREAKGENPSYGVVDQALITMFNKMIDPTSVVRESEYARTPSGQAVIENLQGKIERLQKGGPGITNQFRNEIINTSKALLDVSQEEFDKVVGDYENVANQMSLNKGLVLGSYAPPEKEISSTEYDDPEKEARYQAYKAQQMGGK